MPGGGGHSFENGMNPTIDNSPNTKKIYCSPAFVSVSSDASIRSPHVGNIIENNHRLEDNRILFS